MEFLDKLFEDEDTPIFNAMKKQYRNPMLDFIEEDTNFYSPIFAELRGKYENPMTNREEIKEELIEIPIVQFQEDSFGETEDLADNEIAYLLAEKKRLEEELRLTLLSYDDRVDDLKKEQARNSILQLEKDELVDALIKTVSYVGNDMLPPIDGWSWYDALKKFRPASAENYAKVYEENRPGPRSPLQIHADEIVDGQANLKKAYFEHLSRDPGFLSTFGDDYSIVEQPPIIAPEEGSGRRGPSDPYVVTLSQQIQFVPKGAQPRNENDAYSDTSHSMKGES